MYKIVILLSAICLSTSAFAEKRSKSEILEFCSQQCVNSSNAKKCERKCKRREKKIDRRDGKVGFSLFGSNKYELVKEGSCEKRCSKTLFGKKKCIEKCEAEENKVVEKEIKEVEKQAVLEQKTINTNEISSYNAPVTTIPSSIDIKSKQVDKASVDRIINTKGFTHTLRKFEGRLGYVVSNSEGNIIGRYTFDEATNNFLTAFNYKYNKNNQAVIKILRTRDKFLEERISYDENGNKIESKFFNEDGTPNEQGIK